MTHFAKSISEKIELKETFEFKAFPAFSKKFYIYHNSGWFESKRKDLSPKGVFKTRTVDRKNNRYLEFIIDALRLVRVIRNVDEKLTDHLTPPQK
jgi:hypothetical protein